MKRFCQYRQSVSRILMLFAISVVLFTRNSTAQADAMDLSIKGTGCFVRSSDQTTQTYTVRMQTPECSLTFVNAGSTAQTTVIQVENIDPDYVVVDRYDSAAGLEKTENTLEFQYSAEAGTSQVNIQPWHAYNDDFYFIALSDNQARGTIDVNPVFTQMLQQVNTVNPVFYTSSGDAVHGSRKPETMRLMFDAFIKALRQSTVPLYGTVGNHDYDVDLQTYRQYLGDPDYSFDFGNTRFVFFSTIVSRLHGAVNPQQLDWLRNEISSAQSANVLTFFHHPVSAPSWGKTNQYFIDATNGAALAQLLDEQQITMAINGHAHGYDYRFLTNADVSTITQGYYQLITAGAGGNIGQPNGQHHFILVRVSPEGITHTPINLDEFATTIEYTNNAGGSEIAHAEVTNEADQDLPYLRLKFKLQTPLERILISDQNGAYYDTYYSRAFDDYTVVYLETSAPANSSFTYTVRPATVLHSGTVNTVAVSGEVSWSEPPMTTKTSVPELQAIPDQSSTQIQDLMVTQPYNRVEYEWVEIPVQADATTTYTIKNMSPLRQYEVVVNNELYDRVTAAHDGRISFRYAVSTPVRAFIVKQLDPVILPNIFSIPNSGGTPYVRMFASDSSAVSSWFSFSDAETGSFQLQRARIDDPNEDRLVVSSNTDAELGVYTQFGAELARVHPFMLETTAGLRVATGDLTGDNRDEIVVSADSGRVRVYTYANARKRLRRLVGGRMYGRHYSGSSALAIANIADDGRSELLALDRTGGTAQLKMFSLNNKRKLELLARTTLPISYADAALAIGYFSGRPQPEIAVYAQSDDAKSPGHLYLYVFTPDGQLKQKSHSRIRYSLNGAPQLAAVRVLPHRTDQLFLTSNESNRLAGYTFNFQYQAKAFVNLHPFGSEYQGGIDMGVVDQVSGGTVELITAQLSTDSQIATWEYAAKRPRLRLIARWQPYGEGFTGGVRVAAP